MQWRLGLDLGTNSLGWCAVELQSKRPVKLIDMGVRIFSDGRDPKKGDPLAVQRRDARGARRRRDRLLKRKRQLLNSLIENSLLPSNVEERKALAQLDPYQLRKRALDEGLTRYELGRALFHLGARRGFKSNRKELQSSDKELSQNNQKIEDTKKILEETNSRTLGEFLYTRKVCGKSLRFRPSEKSLYPSRDMYEIEFEKIKEVQTHYYHEINWDDIFDKIFYQRPLRPQERGKCQFYHDNPRAFKMTPSAQRFRILSEVNNLKYYDKSGVLKQLSDVQKELLEYELNQAKSKSFNGIRRLLSLPSYCVFNLEQPGRDKLIGNTIESEMRKEAYFGEYWEELSLNVKDSLIEGLVLAQTDYEVLEMLNSFELSDEQKHKILVMLLPHDTVRLSNAFMRDCIEIMRSQHIRYDEACEQMQLHHSYNRRGRILGELPYYGKILTNATLGAHPEADEKLPEIKYGKIGNPTVHISLNQLRKVVNSLIVRLGNPSEIIVELSRDLKTGKREKQEILKKQTKNKKRNEKIIGELSTTFKIAEPKSWDIKKFLLWEELSENPLERRCLYCGKQIAASQLFSPSIEIEHILPFSRTLSSAMNNLTVAHKSCNAVKKNRTPYEAFGSNPREFKWNEIVERVRLLPKELKVKRDFLLVRDMEELQANSGFLERQINDNRYLSRLAIEYLGAICDMNSIWSTPGKQTSILRAKWGLNTILNQNHDTWYKNRYDHRHHAIDALVIALTDRYLINKMAQLNQTNSPYDIKVPELPFPRTIIEDQIIKIIPSIKLDHGHQGRLFKDTAATKKYRIEQVPLSKLKNTDIEYIESPVIKSMFQHSTVSFVKIKDQVNSLLKEGDKELQMALRRMYWVTRKPIESLTLKDIEKERIFDKSLGKMISSKVTGISDPNELKKRLLEFSQLTGIKRLRYIPDNQIFITVSSEPHKGYENDDFYAVIIWKIPSKRGFTYKGIFISRSEGYAIIEKSVSIDIFKPHPAAKKITTLYKNDIIKIDNPSMKKSIYARIAGYSTTQNKLDIRPVYASEDSYTWIDNTNEKFLDSYWTKQKGHNFKSINALFTETRIKPMKVSPDGKLE